ncbi:MAG: tRNA (N6-threonylcarbamoyladenosine(37)-N6)-methyltransferase TrmO, partial [Gammaproteobacteria bacterium]|nr:tRNA (N6-threonylcarbamoyladenosine(37)-N6)-methyltransferase TrmO [Gammaproteobacteria bacterium]
MAQYHFTSIGTIHSCYKEKFGIPRQPALVVSPATIEIDSAYSKDEAFRELESFSHIWVVFVFHGIEDKKWKATVRPPRLGGNQRVGVFASRSMFRPNPIGLSVVELTSIERKNNNIILNIIGGDFLDLTPVIDIKPYIPYADTINTDKSGYATDKPQKKLTVNFSVQALAEIQQAKENYPQLENIIVEILQLDPRPAYQENKKIKNVFSIKLYDYDLKWHVVNEEVLV